MDLGVDRFLTGGTAAAPPWVLDDIVGSLLSPMSAFAPTIAISNAYKMKLCRWFSFIKFDARCVGIHCFLMTMMMMMQNPESGLTRCRFFSGERAGAWMFVLVKETALVPRDPKGIYTVF